MCGRFSLFAPPDRIEERFDAVFDYPYERRYNATPGQFLPVVTDECPDRIRAFRWGLVPTWADDDQHAPINARAETVAEKPSFRESVRGVGASGTDSGIDATGEAAGRCLVLADGFYEWTQTDGGKQPYRITRADDDPFAMAGLWTRWRPAETQTGLDEFAGGPAGGAGPDDESELVETFTIVTTAANDAVADLHDRMPVILPEDDERRWLTADADDAQSLLAPCPSELVRAYPVSREVDDPANDSRAVVRELDTPG